MWLLGGWNPGDKTNFPRICNNEVWSSHDGASWELVKPKLVLAENISQATQFVASGAAQAGITALSLALAPPVARLGRHTVLPADLHAPLRQRMVLMKTARDTARPFYAWLQSAPAREAGIPSRGELCER